MGLKKFEEAEVLKLPKCAFCGKTAAYDSKTKNGFWAYLCEHCFKELGTGVGLGRGQRLILKKKVEK